MNSWLVLTATLPTQPSALRVRVWRALKATSAGTLREGVYLLPSTAPTAQSFWDIEGVIQQAGADAYLLVVAARDEAQEKTFRELFDRSDLHAVLLQSIKEVRTTIKKASEAELHKALRGLEQQLHAIQAGDFFPGKAHEKSATALSALRLEIERHLSPGEPTLSDRTIEPQAMADFQGKTWATRKRPWVDRLASAWLIQRFVDHSPQFIWLDNPKKCPKGALGYDFDDARFTHVGDKVSFEVLAHTFGLDADVGIQRLGELVHFIDIGGIPVDEAAGVETLVRGLQVQHDKDDALLAASLPMFDSLYAALMVRS
ncbi:MAG: chromate resistance protein ChrB domain-containing protein [Pseudomonadota bacterium]